MTRSSNSRERNQRDRRSHKIEKRDEPRAKPKIVLDRGNNWSKEQKRIEDIDFEEIKRAQSSYIAPESNLGQSNILQSRQKKLFSELMPKNMTMDPSIMQSDMPAPFHPSTIVGKRDSSTYYYKGNVVGITNAAARDAARIHHKIKIPTNTGFNYAGLIIGPKGANQKRLEEETGCRIIVRGRGSQKEGQASQAEDYEDQHVHIAGDTERQVQKAVVEINKILLADEQTRNIIRQEQLKVVAQIKNKELGLAPYLGHDYMNYYGIANP